MILDRAAIIEANNSTIMTQHIAEIVAIRMTVVFEFPDVTVPMLSKVIVMSRLYDYDSCEV